MLVLMAALASCIDDDKPSNDPYFDVIELHTDFGTMYLHLYDSTPIHKANFLELISSGFYDSTEFHRLVPNFVIQGGDPNSKDEDRTNDGTGGPGYTMEAEIDSSRIKHIYGAIGAARLGNSQNPERRSNGSQFYIVTNPNGTPFLDGEYTVFGEVIGGLDVAKTIEQQRRNSSDRPIERIKMWMRTAQYTQHEMNERSIHSPIQ